MTAELHRRSDEAEADAEVRAIILTGAGRGFSAGYDIARRPDGKLLARRHAGIEVGDFLKRWWTNDSDSTQRLHAPLAPRQARHRRRARLGDGRRLLVLAGLAT